MITLTEYRELFETINYNEKDFEKQSYSFSVKKDDKLSKEANFVELICETIKKNVNNIISKLITYNLKSPINIGQLIGIIEYDKNINFLTCCDYKILHEHKGIISNITDEEQKKECINDLQIFLNDLPNEIKIDFKKETKKYWFDQLRQNDEIIFINHSEIGYNTQIKDIVIDNRKLTLKWLTNFTYNHKTYGHNDIIIKYSNDLQYIHDFTIQKTFIGFRDIILKIQEKKKWKEYFSIPTDLLPTSFDRLANFENIYLFLRNLNRNGNIYINLLLNNIQKIKEVAIPLINKTIVQIKEECHLIENDISQNEYTYEEKEYLQLVLNQKKEQIEKLKIKIKSLKINTNKYIDLYNNSTDLLKKI